MPTFKGMHLNELMREAGRIAKANGFTKATPGEDIALIQSEASEALEDIRTGVDLTKVWYEQKRVIKSPVYSMMVDLGYPELDANKSTITIESRHDEFRAPDGKLRKPCGVPSEIADIIIRCLDFCDRKGIDIEKAVDEKMQYNETRGFMHGGKTL